MPFIFFHTLLGDQMASEPPDLTPLTLSLPKYLDSLSTSYIKQSFLSIPHLGSSPDPRTQTTPDAESHD